MNDVMMKEILPCILWPHQFPTFEVVFRLRVVRAHYGRRLAPDHDQHPHPGLRLLLQQLPESEAGRVEL